VAPFYFPWIKRETSKNKITDSFRQSTTTYTTISFSVWLHVSVPS